MRTLILAIAISLGLTNTYAQTTKVKVQKTSQFVSMFGIEATTHIENKFTNRTFTGKTYWTPANNTLIKTDSSMVYMGPTEESYVEIPFTDSCVSSSLLDRIFIEVKGIYASYRFGAASDKILSTTKPLNK